MNDTKDYFRRQDTVACWWHPESPDDPLHQHTLTQLQWASAVLPWAGKQVLDVATGRGRFAIAYAREGADVTAIDLSRQMLDFTRANAQAQQVAFPCLLADAAHLPFPNHSFDVLSCMEAIMHVPDAQAALHEFRRLLRPDGRLLISLTNRYRINALGRLPTALYQKLGLIDLGDLRIMWSYSLPAFRRMLRQAGFAIDDVHGQGLFQPNARVVLSKRLSFAPFPPAFAHWFFTRAEPSLRRTPLKNLMGTINILARPVDRQ